MPQSDARNFVIWVEQSLLPAVETTQMLTRPRLMRVLSHHDEETECFSLQFEVENTALLHKWFTQQGTALDQQLRKTFDERILGFSTILEEVKG